MCVDSTYFPLLFCVPSLFPPRRNPIEGWLTMMREYYDVIEPMSVATSPALVFHSNSLYRMIENEKT